MSIRYPKYLLSMIIGIFIIFISLIELPDESLNINVIRSLKSGDLAATQITIEVENADKYVHFFLYFTLCMSMLWESKYKKNIKKTLYLLLMACIFGGIIELLQPLFSTRTASWKDAACNCFGAFIATFLYILFFYYYGKRKKRHATPISPHVLRED